jgi:hypothetical protein
MRQTVEEEIMYMIENCLLESSKQPSTSPLIFVSWPQKIWYLRRPQPDDVTIPYNQRVPPIQEILQRLEEAMYINNLDLIADFIQTASNGEWR